MNRTSPLSVVTGASSGIGYEFATLCAKDGMDLVIAAMAAITPDSMLAENRRKMAEPGTTKT